jgi:hypothetical protein
MPFNLIPWKRADKYIFAGVCVFGVLNLAISLLIVLGVSW